MGRLEVRLPDLGLGDTPVRVTVWFAARGSRVERGEPILEATAGAVTVDLPSPASGIVRERLVALDDLIARDAPVAVLETDG